MNKPILYISCGIPGSGKTTFLKKNKKEDEILISRDDIRVKFLKEKDFFFKHEKRVYKILIDSIAKGLQEGKNVYADATHLNMISRSKLINSLNGRFNIDYDLEMIYFDVPLSICLERNNKRTGVERVPEVAIRSMYNSLNKPTKEEKARHLWIVDKDGIVSKEW